MLKLLKSKRALLIAVLVTILGWAGFQVAERDVANIVNLVLEEGEKPAANIQEEKRKDLQQQGQANSSTQSNVTADSFNKAARVSPERRTHILYGDATGGGHKHGVGAPCKSEFPAHWDDNTIIKEIEMIAANDNLNWEQQRNGYYVTEQKVGTIQVRVVKGRNGEKVITAYPTNVRRNPCPANDN